MNSPGKPHQPSEPEQATDDNTAGIPFRVRCRRLVLKLLFSVGVLLLALKVGDVLLGWLWNTHQRHWMRLSPNVAVRHQSTEFDYVFRTNSLGLRGPDIPFDKPEGIRRIAVIGDSFVAGTGVSDASVFTVKLQERLREAGNGVQVINVGRTGSSTIREYDLYRLIARRFQPDIVLLVFFLGNDLAEITEELTAEELQTWTPPGLLRKWAYTLYPNTYFELSMLKNAPLQLGERPKSERDILRSIRAEAALRGLNADRAVQRYRSVPAKIRKATREGKFPLVRLLHACLDPGRYRRSLNPDDDYFRKAWPRVTTHLKRLHRCVERDGGELTIVMLPESVQVDPDAVRFNRRLGFEVDVQWLSTTCRTERELRKWCRRNNVEALSLTESFRRSERTIYYVQDKHLNPEGHELTAEILAEWLQESD